MTYGTGFLRVVVTQKEFEKIEQTTEEIINKLRERKETMNKSEDLLKRRENILTQLAKVESEIKASNVPEVKESIDWSETQKVAESIIEGISEGTWHQDNDDKHWLYEAVMTDIYGDKIFTWLADNS